MFWQYNGIITYVFYAIVKIPQIAKMYAFRFGRITMYIFSKTKTIWKFYLKQNKISGNFFQRGISDLIFLNVNHMKVSLPIKENLSEISSKDAAHI